MLGNFTHILFDLDDTLLDFQKSSEISFFKNFENLELSQEAKQVYASFQVISRGLWQQYTQGEVERNFLKVERFRRTFSQHNISKDPDAFAKDYLDGICENVVHIQSALELCQFLKAQGKSLGVVTNGISKVQSRRLSRSPLEPLFDFVLTSDKGRRPKPAPDLFQEAHDLWGSPEKSAVAVIGDNLVCDVSGAQKFGFKGCWFNPSQETSDPGIRSDFEIQSLRELMSFSAGSQAEEFSSC